MARMYMYGMYTYRMYIRVGTKWRDALFLFYTLLGMNALPVASGPAAGDGGDFVSPKIAGGNPTERGDYPYYVGLNGCGGTLIAPDIVLTAAHCLPQFRGIVLPETVYVGAYNAGETSMVGPGGGAEERQCVQWINHQFFDRNRFSNSNDFALCKLDEPVFLDETSVRLEINFESSVPSIGDDLVHIGLGYLEFDNYDEDHELTWEEYNNLYPSVTMAVTLPYIDNLVCDGAEIYDGLIDETMLCAGEEGKGSCTGDSGGPIVLLQSPFPDDSDGVAVHHLVGLSSWSRKFLAAPQETHLECARENSPSVFARVSTAWEWIKYTSCVSLESATAPFCDNIWDEDKVCQNDPEFAYDGVRNQDCSWVKKKPKRVTAICNSPHNGNKVSDSCEITCGKCCGNDKNFRYKSQKRKDCSWIQRNTRFCRSKANKSVRVNDLCPLACGRCCADDPTFRLNNNYKRDCNYVADNRDICDREMVQYACPKACGLCVDEEASRRRTI